MTSVGCRMLVWQRALFPVLKTPSFKYPPPSHHCVVVRILVARVACGGWYEEENVQSVSAVESRWSFAHLRDRQNAIQPDADYIRFASIHVPQKQDLQPLHTGLPHSVLAVAISCSPVESSAKLKSDLDSHVPLNHLAPT